jgi:hypothetical protein
LKSRKGLKPANPLTNIKNHGDASDKKINVGAFPEILLVCQDQHWHILEFGMGHHAFCWRGEKKERKERKETVRFYRRSEWRNLRIILSCFALWASFGI